MEYIKEVFAQYDRQCIRVYQAYNSTIAKEAVLTSPDLDTGICRIEDLTPQVMKWNEQRKQYMGAALILNAVTIAMQIISLFDPQTGKYVRTVLALRKEPSMVG